MMHPPAIVHVVDDEPAVLKALTRLLRSAGHQVESFACARDFLDEFRPNGPACAVLDLSMPGMSGIELQQAVAQLDPTLPIIFLSGKAQLHDGVEAMKGGAVDFLTKPVNDDRLLQTIELALQRSRTARQWRDDDARLRERLAKLTPREHEVMTHVIAGRLNREIAIRLGTVEKTIKVHRARIFEKLSVDSLPELVRFTERAGITPAR